MHTVGIHESISPGRVSRRLLAHILQGPTRINEQKMEEMRTRKMAPELGDRRGWLVTGSANRGFILCRFVQSFLGPLLDRALVENWSLLRHADTTSILSIRNEFRSGLNRQKGRLSRGFVRKLPCLHPGTDQCDRQDFSFIVCHRTEFFPRLIKIFPI
jgi:hypothetical protein